MTPTPEQVAVITNPTIHRVKVELRDPYGAVIATWHVEEDHGAPEHGAYTLGAFMAAFAATEIKALVQVPGADERAPWYFHLSPDPYPPCLHCGDSPRCNKWASLCDACWTTAPNLYNNDPHVADCPCHLSLKERVN